MESSANPLTIGTTSPRCNCHHCDPYAPSHMAMSPNTPPHDEHGRTLHGGNDMCRYGHRRCCGGRCCIGRGSQECEHNPSNTAMVGCQYCGQHLSSRVDRAQTCSHTPHAAEVNARNTNGRNANGENVRNSNAIVSWEDSYLQHSKIPVTDNGGDSAKQDNQVSSTAVTDYLPYGIPVEGDNEVTDAPRWWMPRYAAAVEKQLAENEMHSAQAISTQSSSTTTSENTQNMINHLSEKPSNNPSSNRPVATIPVSISSGPLTRVEQILSTPPEHQAMGFSSPSARKADEDTSMWSMSSPNILEAPRDEPFLHGEHQQDPCVQEGQRDAGPCLQEQRVEASSSQQNDDSSGDLNVLKHKLSHFEMLADHWQRSCMASERENQNLRQKLKILHTEQFRMDHLD